MSQSTSFKGSGSAHTSMVTKGQTIWSKVTRSSTIKLALGLLLVAITIYILISHDVHTPGLAVSSLIPATRFSPIQIYVYDRTPKNSQFPNRLIICKPYDWYYFAMNGKLYSTSNINFFCRVGYFGMYRFTSLQNDVRTLCVPGSLDALVQAYTSSEPYIYSVNIDENSLSFSSLDVCNIIFSNFANMEGVNESFTNVANTGITGLKKINYKAYSKNEKISTSGFTVRNASRFKYKLATN